MANKCKTNAAIPKNRANVTSITPRTCMIYLKKSNDQITSNSDICYGNEICVFEY